MKYSIGDKVIILDSDEGEVIGIIPNGAVDKWKSDKLLLKLKNNEVKCVAASLVDPIPDKPEDLAMDIKNAIDQIFSRPEICSAKTQKELAFELFKYIVMNSKYDDSILDEKMREINYDIDCMEIKDIHRCLCKHRSICTSDAAALSLLLRTAGIPSAHLTIADKVDDEGVHEVVKVYLDNQQYICDPTLTRTCLENGVIPNVNPSVFAFPKEVFFEIIYPSKEIKYEHAPLILANLGEPLSR